MLENNGVVTKFGKFVEKCFGLDMCMSSRRLLSSSGLFFSLVKTTPLG